MAKALVLRAITGTNAGQRHTLAARVNTIGSAANNDLVLHDRLLGPRHVEIKQVLERWFVVPLAAGSQAIALNGLSINGQSRLTAGDALTIGSVTYTIGSKRSSSRRSARHAPAEPTACRGWANTSSAAGC